MSKGRLSIFIVVGIIAGAVIGPIIYFSARPEPPPRTVTVAPQIIEQDVEFTGRLKAERDANVSFEIIGTIQNIEVTEGQAVTAGQDLVILEPTISQLELAKARADQLSSEETARLAWTKAQQDTANTKELSKQSLESKRQAVRNAKTELDQAKAVHEQTQLESGDNSTTKTAVAALRAKESAYLTAQKALDEALESTEKTNEAAAAAEDAARAAYFATIQPSTATTGLSSLEAARELARAKLARGIMTAPFDGVVTNIHYEEGETVTAGSSVITIATVNTLELSAQVTETDAAKIRQNMSATVTFDALPINEQWDAAVIYLAPAAEIIEGVPTFKTNLTVDTKGDDRLKPGLTANITVHAARKVDVIGVPRRAIVVRGTEQHVNILTDNNTVEEQTVQTGLVGTDGTVEITSGLTVGQRVIIDPTELSDE